MTAFETRTVAYPKEATDLARWAAANAARLADSLGGAAPVLLGVSLGAMAALETAQHFELLGLAVGAVVVVSSVAPQHRTPADVGRRSDAALLDLVRASNGALPESFESPDVRDYALAMLRRDLEWADTYTGPQPVPLACPLTVIRGEFDAIVPGIAGTDDWAPWTTGEFTVRTVHAGSHLCFTDPRGAAVVRDSVVRGAMPDLAEGIR